MHGRWTTVVASASALVCVASAAFGAEQTVLGQSFLAKDSGAPTRRRVLVKAKEPSSPNTIVGDPTTGGATLTINANGGTPTTQTFTLPASNWSGDATRGFKYKDPTGAAGAVKLVKVKRARNGKFLLKAVATGKNGTVLIVPPDPGTDACARLTIVAGDSYSVRFGPDSQITNKDGRLFRAKRPLSEGSCVSTTSTTTPTTSTSTPSSTTSTTLYGSPSRAFLQPVTRLIE